MPDNNEGLQLLPETRRRIEIKIPGENRFIYVSIAILAAVLVIWFGLYFYKNSLVKQNDQANQDILTLDKTRDKNAESNISTINKQLTVISGILQNHSYLSKSFSKLSDITQNQIQYKSLNLDLNSNSLLISGVAKDYMTIAHQIAAFNSDDSIKKVELGNITSQTSSNVEFNLKLNFDPSKFSRK